MAAMNPYQATLPAHLALLAGCRWCITVHCLGRGHSRVTDVVCADKCSSDLHWLYAAGAGSGPGGAAGHAVHPAVEDLDTGSCSLLPKHSE